MDERDASEQERALQARVEVLAQQIADTINAGGVDGREALRETAVTLLRDEVQLSEPTPPAGTQSVGTFNPFGIGIPLVLIGAIMVVLFPPVGLLMFAAAAVMILWGVGATLFARS